MKDTGGIRPYLAPGVMQHITLSANLSAFQATAGFWPTLHILTGHTMCRDTNTCGRWPKSELMSPGEGDTLPTYPSDAMIVICKSGRTELIEAPQDPERAWNLADRLTRRTGILHWVGRV